MPLIAIVGTRDDNERIPTFRVAVIGTILIGANVETTKVSTLGVTSIGVNVEGENSVDNRLAVGGITITPAMLVTTGMNIVRFVVSVEGVTTL